MSSYLIKFITNRLIKDNQWNRFGVEDPYFEQVPVSVDANNHPVKYKKIARRIPDGLSSNDYKILNNFKKRAYRYDMWFNLFGVKVGWASIVGLIPVAGAVISLYWSFGLYLLARGLDDRLPLDLQLIFFINIAIDFALLLIPIIGDIIEVGYKANSRNYLLLEKHLIRVGQKNMGIITDEEVRPGFINDKIQPVMDEKVKPGAIKAGQSIKQFVDGHLSSPKDWKKAYASKSATIETSPTTVTMDFKNRKDLDSDAASVRTLSDSLRRSEVEN